MANKKSSKKRSRTENRRRVINRKRTTKQRDAVKAFDLAASAGDVKAATAALTTAMPALQRAASKKILHPRTAARKISRLTKRLKKISTPAK